MYTSAHYRACKLRWDQINWKEFIHFQWSEVGIARLGLLLFDGMRLFGGMRLFDGMRLTWNHDQCKHSGCSLSSQSPRFFVLKINPPNQETISWYIFHLPTVQTKLRQISQNASVRKVLRMVSVRHFTKSFCLFVWFARARPDAWGWPTSLQGNTP